MKKPKRMTPATGEPKSKARTRTRGRSRGKPKDGALAAADIHPVQALQYGYSLYLRTSTAEDPLIHERADAAIREFEELCALFTDPRERVYILALKQAALNLARGIQRKKAVLRDKIAAVEEERRLMQRRLVRSETRSGFMRAGLKLLVLGGVLYLVLHYLRTAGYLPRETSETETTGTMFDVASTLALVLFAAFAKGWFTDRTIHRMFRHYTDGVRQAEREYAEAVQKEYRLSVAMAEDAWKSLTGEAEVPGSHGFHVLMLDVMGMAGGLHDRPAPPEEAPEEARGWVQRLATSLFR